MTVLAIGVCHVAHRLPAGRKVIGQRVPAAGRLQQLAIDDAESLREIRKVPLGDRVRRVLFKRCLGLLPRRTDDQGAVVRAVNLAMQLGG